MVTMRGDVGVCLVIFAVLIWKCDAGSRRRLSSPPVITRRTGFNGCVSGDRRMDLGQRVYLPGCRRLVCKMLLKQAVIEEQFCDDIPQVLPPSCVKHHQPNRRHPDCCPVIVCNPGNPVQNRGKKPPGRSAHRPDALEGDHYIQQLRKGSQAFPGPRSQPPWRIPSVFDSPQASSVFSRPRTTPLSPVTRPNYRSVNSSPFTRPNYDRPRTKPSYFPTRSTSAYEQFGTQAYEPAKLSQDYIRLRTTTRTNNSPTTSPVYERPVYEELDPTYEPELRYQQPDPTYEPELRYQQPDPSYKESNPHETSEPTYPTFEDEESEPTYPTFEDEESEPTYPTFEDEESEPTYPTFEDEESEPTYPTFEDEESEPTYGRLDPAYKLSEPAFKQLEATYKALEPAYKRPRTFPPTPHPLYMTTEVVYGEGLSDPWDDRVYSGRETPRPDFRELLSDPWRQRDTSFESLNYDGKLSRNRPIYNEDFSDWYNRYNPPLESPNNNIQDLSYDDEGRYDEYSDEEPNYFDGKTRSPTHDGKTRSPTRFTETPNPSVITSESVDPNLGVSYTYYTDPIQVKTSPVPHQQDSKPPKLSTTPKGGHNEQSNQSPNLNRETPWKPIIKKTTPYPITTKAPSTTPSAEVTIPSYSSKRPYYDIAKDRTTPIPPTTYRPPIKIPDPSSSRPTTYRPKFKIPDHSSRPASRPSRPSRPLRKIPRRTTLRPKIRKVTTPRVNSEVSTTTPASYQFATPKLNPFDHDIHEFIHYTLDPSALIPGHDEYVESKNNANKKYNDDSEEGPSKKTRRSLSYPESTLPYDETSIPSEVPVGVINPTADTSDRQKRGRPVFYIPWRDNLVSKPYTTPTQPDFRRLPNKSFPTVKLETLYFDQLRESQEKPITFHLPSNPFTSVSFESVDTGDTEEINSPNQDKLNLEMSERLKNLQRIQEILRGGSDTTRTTTTTTTSTTAIPTTTIPPTTHATVAFTTPFTTTSTTAQPDIPTEQPTSQDLETTTIASPAQVRGLDEEANDLNQAYQEEKQVESRQPQQKSHTEDIESATQKSDTENTRKIVWSPPPFRQNPPRHSFHDGENSRIPVPYYGDYPDNSYLGAILYEPEKHKTHSPLSSTTDTASTEIEIGDETKNFEVTTPVVDHQSSEEVPVKVNSKYDSIIRESQFQSTDREFKSEYKPSTKLIGDHDNPFGTDHSTYSTQSDTSRTSYKTEDSYYEAETYEHSSDFNTRDSVEETGRDFGGKIKTSDSNDENTSENIEPKIILANEHTTASDLSTTKVSVSPTRGLRRRQRRPNFESTRASLNQWFSSKYDEILKRNESKESSNDSINSRDEDVTEPPQAFIPQQNSESSAQNSRPQAFSPQQSRDSSAQTSRKSSRNKDNIASFNSSSVSKLPTSIDKSPASHTPRPQSPIRNLRRHNSRTKSKSNEHSTSDHSTSRPSSSRLDPKYVSGSRRRISAKTRGRYRPRLKASRTTASTEGSLQTSTVTQNAPTTTESQVTEASNIDKTILEHTTLEPAVDELDHIPTSESSLIASQWEKSTTYTPAVSVSPSSSTKSPHRVTLQTRGNKLRSRLRGRLPPIVVKRKRVLPNLKVSRTRQPASESVQQARVLTSTEALKIQLTQPQDESTESSQLPVQVDDTHSSPKRNNQPSNSPQSPRVASFQYKSMIHTPHQKERTTNRASRTQRRRQNHSRTQTSRTKSSSTEAPRRSQLHEVLSSARSQPSDYRGFRSHKTFPQRGSKSSPTIAPTLQELNSDSHKATDSSPASTTIRASQASPERQRVHPNIYKTSGRLRTSSSPPEYFGFHPHRASTTLRTPGISPDYPWYRQGIHEASTLRTSISSPDTFDYRLNNPSSTLRTSNTVPNFNGYPSGQTSTTFRTPGSTSDTHGHRFSHRTSASQSISNQSKSPMIRIPQNSGNLKPNVIYRILTTTPEVSEPNAEASIVSRV